MTTRRWQEIETLFDRLIDLPAAERTDRIEALSGEFPADVVAEVAALLEQVESTDGFLDTARGRAAAQALQLLEPGDVVGVWVVENVLGSGGQSQVYACTRNVEGATQRGALKILGGVPSAAATRRMLRERQALASLAHQSIPTLLDGGVTAQGLPYLVVELVEGEALAAYLAREEPNVKRRVEILLALCDSLVYAHSRLLVHRDVKPGNVLMGIDGRVRLLDFGIARALDDDGATATQPLFTLGFAAPEQARGEPASAAIDIHGLGALAYWLFAGRSPHQREDPAQTLHAVLQEEPPPLGEVPRELSAIIGKALRKRPEDRYASVDALRADLNAFLAGQPVEAVRGGNLYRFRKFARRHAFALGVGTTALGLVLAALTSALQSARVAETARDQAQAEASKFRAISDIWGQVFAAANPAEVGQQVQTPRELMVQARDLILAIEGQPAAQVELLLQIGNTHLNRGEYQEALAVAESLAAIEPTTIGLADDDRTQVYLLLGTALKTSGAVSASVTPLETAVERLRRFPSDQTVAMPYTLNMLATSLAAVGRLEEALDLQSEIGELVSRGDELPSWLVRMHRANEADLLFKLERFELVEQRLQDNLGRADLDGENAGIASTYRFLGQLALADGRPAEAAEHFEAGLAAVVGRYALDTSPTRMDWLRARSAAALAGSRSLDGLLADLKEALPVLVDNTQLQAESHLMVATVACQQLSADTCGDLLGAGWLVLGDTPEGRVAGEIALAQAEYALSLKAWSEAETWAKRAVELLSTVLPAGHTLNLHARSALGAAIARAERRQVRANEHESIQRLRERWGPSHVQVERARSHWR